MRVTRRTFLASGLRAAAVLGGGPLIKTATARAQSSPPVRMRLEEFVRDPKRVEALKRGVAVMKSRPPSDPRSWFFQAAVHAVSDEWVRQAQTRDPKVAQIDRARFWKQCPHFGQSSADFFVWHRAYVYYFERILREAAQDPTLSLPHWNYTDATQRRFPEVFADPDPDPLTQLPRNPLFDARREYAFMYGVYELTAAAVAVPEDREFFGETESSGFAGGIGDQNDQTRGRVEVRPHDQLHFAIGGVIGFGTSPDQPPPDARTRGLMASVQTAAFDPIFWVHHCNIDRIWSVWDCLPDRRWGTVPPQHWFTAKPWSFYDVDGTVHNYERAHYLTHGRLGIRFDTDDPQCNPLSAQPPYGPTFTVAARAATGAREGVVRARSEEIGRSDSIVTPSARGPVTHTVPLRSGPVLGASSLMSALSAQPPPVVRRVVMELRRVTYRSVPSVRYDIFVNLPAGATPERARRHFVGTLALFGLEDPSHVGHDAAGQQFDITHLAGDPSFDPSALRLTVAPLMLLRPRGNAPELRRDGRVSIGGIKVSVVEGRFASGP